MKSRMGSEMSLAERRLLTEAMLRDILEACETARNQGWISGVVITQPVPEDMDGKTTVEKLTQTFGFDFFVERSRPDFDAILGDLTDYALRVKEASSTILLFSDLPLISPDNLRKISKQLASLERGIVIAASQTDGVSCLGRKPAAIIPTQFSTGKKETTSFIAHIQAARQEGVPLVLHDSFFTHFDADIPIDLVFLRNYLEIAKPKSHTLKFLCKYTANWKVSKTPDSSNRNVIFTKE